MKSKSRPKKKTEGQKKKRRPGVPPRTAEELAALWSKGINMRITPEELAGLCRVPVGNIYLRLHRKTLPITPEYFGKYPRFWLADAMGNLHATIAAPA
jgi:hypothetical protein